MSPHAITRSSPDGVRMVTVCPTRTSIAMPRTSPPLRRATASEGSSREGTVIDTDAVMVDGFGLDGTIAQGAEGADSAHARSPAPRTLAATVRTTCRIGCNLGGRVARDRSDGNARAALFHCSFHRSDIFAGLGHRAGIDALHASIDPARSRLGRIATLAGRSPPSHNPRWAIDKGFQSTESRNREDNRPWHS